MDDTFKNLSFPVNFWHEEGGVLRSLAPLSSLGFMPRKTGWLRTTFDTVNFSLIERKRRISSKRSELEG